MGPPLLPPLHRDLLQALALMDAVAGAGGDFWGDYANALLPAPEALTLPLCWGERLLGELQHDGIAAAARQQQQRLAALFPGLSRPLEADGSVPSWLQWGFACVRSRAFKVGEEAWASIPFLDMGEKGGEREGG